MSTASDAIRILIDETYPDLVDALNQNIVNLNDQLATTTAEIISINDGVLDVAESIHLPLLEAKRVANGWYDVNTFNQYGIENLTEWQIRDWTLLTASPVYVNSNEFKVLGNHLATYPNGRELKLDCDGDGIKFRTVQSTTYNGFNTFVVLQAGTAITSNLTSVDGLVVVYSPTVNWDSDVNIQEQQDAFAIGHDHLHKAPDLTGTYGLVPRTVQIGQGISVQTINRNKYSQLIIVYEPYATP